jgi:hypothetical protein
VPVVQQTFTHKQYTERHKTNSTCTQNTKIYGRVRTVPSLWDFITLMTSGQQYNTMMHLQTSIAYKAKKICSCVNCEDRWVGSGITDRIIHNLCTCNIKASSQLHAPAVLTPRGKKPRYLLNKFGMNSTATLDAFKDDKNILPFP